MFVMTHEWLMANYGSEPHQIDDTRNWLLKYGKNVPEEQLDLWSQYNHLAVFQPNTPNIVPTVLARLGYRFASELQAHMFINTLRVPIKAVAYKQSLRVCSPKTILELGLGGAASISTAIFLHYLESVKGELTSVDIAPPDIAEYRYGKYNWVFIQGDSLTVLETCTKKYDMVFIDTIHSYIHTLSEMQMSARLTDNILMDDTHFEGNDFDTIPGGVKRAVSEFLKNDPSWRITYYGKGTVAILQKA